MRKCGRSGTTIRSSTWRSRRRCAARCYAPGPEDRLLLREQALVDGLLVRKYKVLLEMQRERRRAEAEEGEVEWDSASLGLIEAEPEGGPGADPACGIGPAALPEDGGKVGP